MNVASIIIADENEGRRNLLANTFEREGYDVTRLSTLAQTEATASAVLPDVLLLEGEWSQGSALDVCQNLSSQPRFRSGTRTVLLSRTTAPDFLSSAAMAGVAEVIGKPVDMNQLIGQVGRHAAKQFVPPPADVSAPQGGGFGGGQRFDVSMTMNDSQWALPMLRRLVEAGNIDDDFVRSIREEMGSEEDQDDTPSADAMTTMVRLALNRLVGAEGATAEAGPASPSVGAPKQATTEEEATSPTTTSVPSFKSINKGATLGEGAAPSIGSTGVGSSMEDILEKQAEDIARTVEAEMDGILDEEPEYVALLDQHEQVGIDPETLSLTRLTAEVLSELMQALKRPGALSDLTLLTQVEDASVLAADMLDALPKVEEEE
jgi:CheY-like chemotaxis protein